MNQDADYLAGLLKVLANANRLQLLCGLSHQELNVSQLGLLLPELSQSALSQHLAILKKHGVLTSRKDGLKVYYQIADDRIEKVIRVLQENYCPDSQLLL
ncbi:MAG: metalloregulator ArsR/SmtB family transcription factor [Oscillospiraceae bacterium]|nr:metalloregulator ArsR/SmtB family transcription factor [Oscillospiraceae bacterium]MDD4367538.1 metalloregulator ArsR/SmtB family transcription factor [Oscillospiraceae bacterium]